MRYYLGLDNGGTTTKAALFGDDGTCLGVDSASTEAVNTMPGFSETDMEEKWNTNCAVIKRLIGKTGISPSLIRGIGICGHGKGLYLWGKDGRPARNGIMSTDTRAYRYVLRWREDGTEKAAFEKSCQHVMECQPVALLAWIRDNEPEVYGNVKYVFECKDYVRFRLTGKAMAERTDYSGAHLLNLYTGDYDDGLLDLFGISDIRDALPPLAGSCDICGYVSREAAAACGLDEGTPVIGGMFDIDACALATGIFDESNICAIAGTWSINEYIRKTPVTDGSVRMNSMFSLPGYYLVEESSPTSAGNFEWFNKNLMPELFGEMKVSGNDPYEYINSLVCSIPPNEFVPVFLPYIMASNVHPNARGSFVGINLSTTRAHMLRSMYEGIVFCHRMHIDRLIRSRRSVPACIRLAGGAARSSVWAQMFADVLGIPVETVDVEETGAFGCALAISVAVGDHKDLTEAYEKMCGSLKRYEPRSEYAQTYEKKYNLYLKTVSCLDGLWDEMQGVIEG